MLKFTWVIMEIWKRWVGKIVNNRKKVFKRKYSVFGIENKLYGGLKMIESHMSIDGFSPMTLEVELMKTQQCTC